tara:strand:+ start:947 stop:1663 length:717 start_codon:yes stop_codon:yes gene_type:complete
MASPAKARKAPSKVSRTVTQNKGGRRTQSERTSAMRSRLIKATLSSLSEEGYSATTVSSIVRRAGVTRGAQLHHFPNKNSLILETAEHLMRRAYRVLGDMLLEIAEDEDRLVAIVDGAWEEMYGTRQFGAYLELMVAARHDPELAQNMQKLSVSTLRTVEGAIAHYFQPRGSKSESPHDLFVMMHCLMSGWAASRATTGGTIDLRNQMEVWARLMASQIKARRGVRSSPPKPPDWDAR